LAFHVTCGLNEDLCMEYREGRKGDIVAGFCRTHTDLWEKVRFLFQNDHLFFCFLALVFS
jgi:hypothetical protein